MALLWSALTFALILWFPSRDEDSATSQRPDFLEPISPGGHPPCPPHHVQAGQLYLRELRGMEASAKGWGMMKL